MKPDDRLKLYDIKADAEKILSVLSNLEHATGMLLSEINSLCDSVKKEKNKELS